MRFSSAIVLTVVAALASSIPATPIDAAGATSADKCPLFCLWDSACSSTNCDFQQCTYFFCTV
ncbi:hypothetical protein BDR03DRAFT_952366, partial [Suillus americanus]